MSEPIRVLQVIGIMDLGGAETMIMNLYRHMDRSKVQFDFVENMNDGAHFDQEIRELGGKIYRCPRFTGKNYFAYRKWWKNFFDTHTEYAFVHGHIGSTAAIYLKEAKNHGIRTIAHSHNTSAKTVRQVFYDVLAYPTRHIADYLFMCSIQAGVDRYGKKAVSDKNRAYFVPNAIDTEHYRFNISIREKTRQELGVSENTLLVGHVGRFAEQKNHLFLLDIFREIAERMLDAKLLLVGDGTLREKIEEEIDNLGLKDKVIMAGNRTDVSSMLMAMDVFVFPSLFEGLPVSLVEAQCSGLPCVISDRVPSDGVLIREQVQVKTLGDPSAWAEAVINSHCGDRTVSADMIKDAGFDIVTRAKKLEDFYLGKGK